MIIDADKQTRWESLTVSEWYGRASQTLDYWTGTAIWYHSGNKPVTVRWVLVRMDGKLTSPVSDDTHLEAYQIIAHLTRPGDTKDF